MPKGFLALIAAQFASGLADNALMVLGVFFLQEQGYPGWWAPLLKFFFNLAYVLLASVVGPLADRFSKSALMAWMGVLKISSVLLLLCGVHPLLAFALTGLAAASYAPAKYGLVTESVNPSLLVKANAWLEVSVVMSVLLGIACGGWLIGLGSDWIKAHWVFTWSGVDTQALGAFAVVLAIYVVSVGLNAWVGPLQKATPRIEWNWTVMSWRSFQQSNCQLWRDPLGGLSLYVTTLFWGVGAVLQFAVLLWAQSEMALSLQVAAYLQALVAVGVVVGAVLAARYFQIFNARRVLPWGFVLALMMPMLALTRSLWVAVPMLMLAGMVGGLLMVPMNAVLQHRGAKILSAGRSIAVQGFNENLSVLIMLGAYSALLAYGVSLMTIMLAMCFLLVGGLVPLFLGRRRWMRAMS
jgi:LPLT family lysophospholipid transporter-like MFS transporter